MSKFIKFTNMLLNTNDIHKIVIQPNKYFIHTASKKIDGWNWTSRSGLGIGHIASDTDEIEVCKIKSPINYDILTDWISKN